MGVFKDRKAKGLARKDIAVVAVTGVFAKRRLAANVVDVGGKQAPPPLPDNFDSLEQCQIAVEVHLQRLSTLKTLEEKAAYKLKALEDINPFVDLYISSGHNYPNSVAVECAIWQLDCGLIDKALPLALLLIKQQQIMPKRFSSSMGVWLCDTVYTWSANKLTAEEAASPYLGTLIEHMQTEQWDLHEPVGSKLFAMAAKHADLQKDYAEVVRLGEIALGMNDKAGVKKLVNIARAELGKNTV